jgi:hypothetical protein
VILPQSPQLCQHDGLSVLSSEKSRSRPSEASKLGGDNSLVIFGQEFPGKRGSVRQCIVMMQQPILLFGAKSSHIFTQSP